jgi:hypothetical protein
VRGVHALRVLAEVNGEGWAVVNTQQLNSGKKNVDLGHEEQHIINSRLLSIPKQRQAVSLSNIN